MNLYRKMLALRIYNFVMIIHAILLWNIEKNKNFCNIFSSTLLDKFLMNLIYF